LPSGISREKDPVMPNFILRSLMPKNLAGGKEILDSFHNPSFIQSDNYDEFRTAVTTKE
jgi:hypothetical protein